MLEFHVTDHDRETGLPVERKLTVTGDPKHGLPTAKDEDVYLGLLQLTKFHTDFTSPAVRLWLSVKASTITATPPGP